MALNRVINISSPDDEYIDKLWRNFVGHYDYVIKSRPVIKYPDREFREQGVPKPWQTIAWRRVIRKLGEENFCKLPLELNYLGYDKVLFEDHFIKHFGNNANPEDLRVTFACGYFWKHSPNRRGKMLDFVVNNILKKGTKVEIWTQDDTLEKDFVERLDNSKEGNKPDINVVDERIDLHFTLVEDKNALENSLILLELPHTEAHYFRLETYLTYGELKKFNCKPDKFVKILRSYINQGLFKRLCSKHDRAIYFA
jgi:hypothetical protein